MGTAASLGSKNMNMLDNDVSRWLPWETGLFTPAHHHG